MYRKRIGKGVSLAFFLMLGLSQTAKAQNASEINFPVIASLDSRDNGFKQYISDVEGNRKRLMAGRRRPEETVEYLTIYRYTAGKDDDILSLAARCNIPYSAIASLNRLNSTVSLEAGKVLLLPSCPGIFIPAALESDLEKLLGAGRAGELESVEIKISGGGRTQTFQFFPGADFTPTERAFFLNSGFRFPLKSFRLTSPYGVRQNPVTGSVAKHQGLDLAAPEGTDVFAAADGVVTGVGTDPVYGNYIIITHSEKWSSLYGHLQKIETVLRSAVKSGNLIGKVGSTGQSTGPHLHFELRQDGRALDPAGMLRR